MKKEILMLSAMLILSGTPILAAEPESIGTLNITVIDENGVMVPEAPVYIYGENKTKFTGGKDVPGSTTLTMPAGTYRISSAIVKKTGDYLDRFASHEAHIQVIAGDNTVLVLKLMPINPAESLTFAELKGMGVSSLN
jgi:hypothetical protein